MSGAGGELDTPSAVPRFGLGKAKRVFAEADQEVGTWRVDDHKFAGEFG